MNKLLFSLMTFAIAISASFGQNCGTVIPKGYFDMIKQENLKQAKLSVPYNTIPNIVLSITAFIAGDEIDPQLLSNAVSDLNTAFKPIGISFSICNTVTIQEAGFADLTEVDTREKLFKLYNATNSINVYFADKLGGTGNAIVCGLAYLPTTPAMDYIFVNKDCDINTTLIHEMGHFFGLLHTHETEEYTELVNGTNCNDAGDLICDTEASPNLLELVSQNCEYIGNEQDVNGDYYLPTVSNYMSYSLDECVCKFTPGQYSRMLQFYWSHKSHLR